MSNPSPASSRLWWRDEGLRIVNAHRMDQLLCTLGFQAVRQKGSHIFYRHPDGRTTTVPHSGRDLAGLLIHELPEIELFRGIERLLNHQ
jgi:predicted RNA binding protein YcfA (HicA-like mRNA interferase family)